ncbi:ABC transporter ATP-binding protein [Desertibaculum subflavum]|uniref:ABC transporter ATP-binding protein n=1 Tax=Desertibaculum subflavum TaxID=2268458 RepID=UPI000E6687E7
MSAALVEAERLRKVYALPRERLTAPAPQVVAVDGVSFTLQAGRSLAVVGESGSGKSTLARLVMALEPPTAGRILQSGRDLAALSPGELRRARADFQMVFQDPYGSLDPRRTVGWTIAEPLSALTDAGRAEQRERVAEMLAQVGLRAADAEKYPHEFSGGQRQRIAIARALITRPKLIVADEPVSALDVSVQAQVLNLMRELEARFGVTYLLISHDLAVVNYVAAEIAVMYRGRIVEQAPTRALFDRPAHPYTRALLEAVPKPEPGRTRRRRARAEPAGEIGTGCSFAPRCPFAIDRCRVEAPSLRKLETGHAAACHRAEEVIAG